MSPFSQMFTIQEATPQQREHIDKNLRDTDHAWHPLTSDQVEARRRYLREDLFSFRPNTKTLVMTPKRCPATIDEIYCTVTLHHREVLMAGGGKAPRLISGFIAFGVVVPAAIRMSGYATAMMRRLLGDKNAADAQSVFEDDLRRWLCIGEPEVLFNGGFDPDGVAAHLWNKFGSSDGYYKVNLACDRVAELNPLPELLDSHRKLSKEQTIEALVQHNQLLKREWFEQYQSKPFKEEFEVQMLAPLEDYVCRVGLREWTAKRLGVDCPKTWGIELHEPGHQDWAFIAFVHCFEERRLQVVTYHARNKASLHTLLYLMAKADDNSVYEPTHILIRPTADHEFENTPEMNIFEMELSGYNRMVMLTNQRPDITINHIGSRVHEQDIRYC